MNKERNLYKEYMKERQGCDFIEIDNGFATYRIEGPICYIGDVYIDPKHRQQGLSHKLADTIAQEAKEKGCSQLMTTINMAHNGENYANVYTILKYGFRLVRSSEYALYFLKRL